MWIRRGKRSRPARRRGGRTCLGDGPPAAIDVFKLRESDITAGPPRYTVHQLRGLFYGDYTPFTGKLHRFVTDTIGVYVSAEDLEKLPSVRRAIDKLFVGDGSYHISKLTNGTVQYVKVSSEPFPRDSPVIFVHLSFGVYQFSHHSEWADQQGVIRESSMSMAAGANDRTTVAFFLHALGLSGSVNGNDTIHIADVNANPSRFALLALKILYGSPPGTRF